VLRHLPRRLTMTASDCSEPDGGSTRGPTHRRLEDLERRFPGLDEYIDDSPVKQGPSTLYGMIQELRREQRKSAGGTASSSPLDIANLSRRAPRWRLQP
jgi:hypothetical protein